MDDIAQGEFDIATDVKKNLQYWVAKTGLNVDINGLFFDIE